MFLWKHAAQFKLSGKRKSKSEGETAPESPSSKRQIRISVGEDVEKIEPSYTAGGG